MKHFILLILLAFSQITMCAPRSAMLSEEEIADLQTKAATRNESEDAKNDRKRDLILSALGAVINATNMVINRKDEDKVVVKQEAQKMLNNIFNFISVITKRGVEVDPQVKELITELLTACGHLKQSLHISERGR